MNKITSDYDFAVFSCNRTISILNQYLKKINSEKEISKAELQSIIRDVLSEYNAITISFLCSKLTDEDINQLNDMRQVSYELVKQILSISIEKLQF